MGKKYASLKGMLLLFSIFFCSQSRLVVKFLKRGIEDKPIVFNKYRLEECYIHTSVSSFMYIVLNDKLRVLSFIGSECSGAFSGYIVRYGEGTNFSFTDSPPTHIAFNSSKDIANCPNRNTIGRMYYTDNVFVCDDPSLFCRYQLSKNAFGDSVLYLVKYKDEKCKNEIKRTKTQECNTCFNGVMYQCKASKASLLFVSIVLYIFI